MTGLIGAVADLITTALTVIALAIGTTVLLCWAIFGLMGAVAFVQVRRRRKREQAAIGDDVVHLFGSTADIDAEIERWLKDGDHRG